MTEALALMGDNLVDALADVVSCLLDGFDGALGDLARFFAGGVNRGLCAVKSASCRLGGGAGALPGGEAGGLCDGADAALDRPLAR